MELFSHSPQASYAKASSSLVTIAPAEPKNTNHVSSFEALPSPYSRVSGFPFEAPMNLSRHPHPSFFFFWHHKGIELMHPHSLHVPDQLSNSGGLSRPLLLECPTYVYLPCYFCLHCGPKISVLGELDIFCWSHDCSH